MVHVECPSRHPHGSQRACCGSSGATMTHRARSVVRSEVVGGWTVDRKVSTGAIDGPRHTCLTRLRVLARSEEGGRQRCGGHRCGRWCRSTTLVKVSVLQVGVQLRALAKLLALRTGREEGCGGLASMAWWKTEASVAVTTYRRQTRVLVRTSCNVRASFYRRPLRRCNVSCTKRERGREVIARRGDKASIRSRGARVQQQWESRGGHASWALSIRRCWGGERDRGGGNPGVHVVHRGAPVHRAYPAMHVHTGSATQGPRRRAFGRVSSASRTSCVRLHRRAPLAVSSLA
jgi:hypothetical protein